MPITNGVDACRKIYDYLHYNTVNSLLHRGKENSSSAKSQLDDGSFEKIPKIFLVSDFAHRVKNYKDIGFADIYESLT